MLRTSFRSLASNTSALFSSSLVLLCNKDVPKKNPYESKFARRSQKEAGMELAQTYAQRFAEVHKQQVKNQDIVDGNQSSSSSSSSDEVPFKKTATPDNTHTGFKDDRANNDKIDIEALRKRLIFQSRYRGMAELDLILGSFAECVLPTATPTELVEYDAILRELDTDLFHWLVTIPGRQKDLKAAGGKSSSLSSHSKQTAQSILAGTSDYADVDKKSAAVEGATPTVDDEFIEPKELLDAEWHRKDDTPEALEKNAIWAKLRKFCEEGREDIVKYR